MSDTQITNRPPDLPANPFATERHRNINQGAVAIEESRAITEAQGKLLLAKRFPRDQASAYEAVMNSCRRQSLAESAFYSYPRGGETVSGPSIRLAEELARCWGNIEFGLRELSQGDGFSELEAYCWDLQTNVYSSQKFMVKHERHTRSGVKNLTDPRDIYEMTANQGARRLRARIMAVLPPDLIESAVSECKATLAGGKVDPKRILKMLTSFQKYGVTQAMLEARYGRRADQFTGEDVADMIGIGNSLRDNQSTVSQWFEGVEDPGSTPSAVADLNAALKSRVPENVTVSDSGAAETETKAAAPASTKKPKSEAVRQPAAPRDTTSDDSALNQGDVRNVDEDEEDLI